jgi:hypothetical protein
VQRVANAAAVVLVAAVAVAAGWDALRPAREPVSAADELRGLGASGQILFSDDACARRRLLLPGLEVTEVPRISGCSVFGHRGSLGIVGGEVGWYAYPGGVTMLLTREQLERETGLAGARVISAAWLANTRFAALVGSPASDERLLALFDADRLARRVDILDAGYRELRSSPRGGWFAALDSHARVLLYDAAGEQTPLPPQLERPHAIAWSRDDRLAAAAEAGRLVLFRPGQAEPRAVGLSLRVRDLAWRR